MKGRFRSVGVIARWVALLLFLVPLPFAGCGDGHGPGPYDYAGAPCRADFDCPEFTMCVDEFNGVCLPICRSDFDCDPRDHCKETSRRGTGGKTLVCVLR